MADKRITKTDRFTTLRTLVNLAAISELVDASEAEGLTTFIDHEIALIAKRHNGSKPNPKVEAEKRAVRHEILNAIAAGNHRASEIAGYADMSVQKVTANLRQMVAAGEVTRTMDKKVARFTLE